MIKHIINIIKGWFTPKEEIDPHEEMLYPKKSDMKIYAEIDGKLKEIKHCKGHRRYRNNCEDCRKATA